MQPHAALTVERQMLCLWLNFKKLALEACKDLSSQRPPKLRTPYSSSTMMPRWMVVYEEKEALRLELRRMRSRMHGGAGESVRGDEGAE